MSEEAVRHTSASAAAAALCGDPAAAARVQAHARSCALVTLLISLRLSKGQTQTAVARAMGVHPSTVSKLEASDDASVRLGDVVRYASAVGVEPSIIFNDKSLPAAARIKAAVFSIHEGLNLLAEIAKEVAEDRSITDKINEFYREVLVNFMLRYKDSHERLQLALRLGGTGGDDAGTPTVQITEPAAPVLPQSVPAG